MLQKEFFQVQPFNPYPYEDGTVLLDLVGGQQYIDNTIFPIGKYEFIVRGGGVKEIYSGGNIYNHCAVTIDKIINITTPFLINAFCGSDTIATQSTQTVNIGTNPYSGIYKVNGVSDHNIQVLDVNHIFGNAGSAGYVKLSSFLYANIASSGNCLGNGAMGADEVFSMVGLSGAGSCLHVIPLDGVFGTDYLFAFQVSGATSGQSASGSAYGGGASSNGSIYPGGNTPYGVGGFSGGADGSGIGHGNKNGASGAAYFNGSSWENISSIIGNETDGNIKIVYVGPLD